LGIQRRFDCLKPLRPLSAHHSRLHAILFSAAAMKLLVVACLLALLAATVQGKLGCDNDQT
jgi:hypothetical protein